MLADDPDQILRSKEDAPLRLEELKNELLWLGDPANKVGLSPWEREMMSRLQRSAAAELQLRLASLPEAQMGTSSPSEPGLQTQPGGQSSTTSQSQATLT